MHVADLELCKELYQLSGWEDTVWHHWKGKLYTIKELRGQTMSEERYPVPAYDLGYLLQKLPRHLDVNKSGRNRTYLLELANGDKDDSIWIADYMYPPDRSWYLGGNIVYPNDTEGKTPEDAVCNLAIELFKQGILKKAGDGS